MLAPLLFATKRRECFSLLTNVRTKERTKEPCEQAFATNDGHLHGEHASVTADGKEREEKRDHETGRKVDSSVRVKVKDGQRKRDTERVRERESSFRSSQGH